MSVSIWVWVGVLALILLMLAIDLFAHRSAKVIGFREAAWWSLLWVSLGTGFGVYIWSVYGSEFGQEYFAGFIIEKSLAVDNVFVWALIFAAFSVPREYQHRILFLGVIGALIFRGIAIALGYTLINSFGWILYVFAAFLVWTGIQMMLKRNEHMDPTKSKFLKLFRAWVPNVNKFYGQRLLVKIDGRLLATPLLLVLVLVEFTDIVFAVDSIPAIFAVTNEPFIVFTSNAFAILGLRAMYFLLGNLIHRFIYLKIGLSVILVWVGIKMALHDIYKVPTSIALGVIFLVIAVSIIASLVKTRGQSPHEPEVETKQVFEHASEAEILELEKLSGSKR